jgi:3-hydroxyisobutyrate dehydrogenase-like beta-hydroxyacid dehydrogenase
MANDNAAITRIAFIGFGEVGDLFARGLLASGRVAIAAYDLKLDDPAQRDAMAESIRRADVLIAGTAADAVMGAEVVVSAVTASAAEAVAAGCAPALVRGALFFDVNSAAPSTKARAAAFVAAHAGDYVEGAVMAPVKEPGLRVPILTGGARAAELSERLNRLGMNLTPVSEEIGRASATKLCRSIVIKGLEALMIDCAAAARRFGVDEDVFASLGATFPSIDFAALADLMAGRVAQHGVRRAAEMREAAEMLADAGFDPSLCLAIADAQERGAARGQEGRGD